MPTNCPACGTSLVPVAVPADIREYAPEDAETIEVCPHCLRVFPSSPENSHHESDESLPAAIPSGNGGAALLLLIGLLDSIALNRASIQTLLDYAEAAGTDVFLAIDRLSEDDAVEAHVDLARRRRQLESLL